VRDVKFHFDSFSTQSLKDTLKANIGPVTYFNLSGAVGAGDITASSGAGFQINPLNLTFETNGDTTGPGFQLTKVNLCCDNVASAAIGGIEQRDMTTGVLIGTGDIVQTGILRNDASTSHMTIVMEGVSTSDFDLYVKCGAEANSAATADFKSESYNNQEFIHLPTGYCSTSTIYIGVASFNGSGMFRLMASEHLPNRHMVGASAIKVGFNWTLSAQDKTDIYGGLTATARELYGMTAGTVQLEEYKVWSQSGSCATGCGGSACTVCFRPNGWDMDGTPGPDTRSWTDTCTNATVHGSQIMYPSRMDQTVLAHEFGHLLFCNLDEYEADKCLASGLQNDNNCDGAAFQQQCNHSPMIGFANFNRNWHICTDFNHHTDYRSNSTNAPNGNLSGWGQALAAGIVPSHSLQPNPISNFTWNDHDFNSDAALQEVGRISEQN
jgi:hypothetical protein